LELDREGERKGEERERWVEERERERWVEEREGRGEVKRLYIVFYTNLSFDDSWTRSHCVIIDRDE
jgi:hypothetical protein